MKNLFKTSLITSLILCCTFAFAHDSSEQISELQRNIIKTKSEIRLLKFKIQKIQLDMELLKQESETERQKIQKMTPEELVQYAAKLERQDKELTTNEQIDIRLTEIQEEIELSEGILDNMTPEELVEYAIKNNFY